MKKILHFKKIRKQSSLNQILGLFLILLIVTLQPAKAQLISHAVDLYSGPEIVDKPTVFAPVTKSASIPKQSFSSLTASGGIWTPVASLAPHYNFGVNLLLSDGRVLCHSSGGITGDIYDILTPDINGSYINGTWSQSAESQRWRLFFSSDVLKDGRVYVAGGEYGTGGSNSEVYNPVTNTWSLQSTPGHVISDGNSEILPDGRILQALLYDFTTLKHTAIFDPVTNTYSAGPDSHGVHNESMWLKLPDNSILMVDMQRLDASYTFTTPPHSERYIPSSSPATGTWVVDADVPVNLYDPYGYETGPAFLLPDGRAFFMGSTGHTAYYTPSGTSSPGTWAAGPDIPNGYGMPDAGGSMMPNGKILFACSPPPISSDHFPSPTYWYEFDYTTNTYVQINSPGGGLSSDVPSYLYTTLNLPDGNILVSIDQTNVSDQYYIYTPDGTPVASGKPTINNVVQIACDTYTIDGTQFNGISEGSEYGDDNQNATNYPLVRLTSGSNVYYARTYNWSSTGVQRGNIADVTTFQLPAGLPDGTYSLVVTANGIASDPVSLTTGPLTWYNDVDGDGYYGIAHVNCGPPSASGWSLTTLGPDCDDTNSNVWQTGSFFADADGDGYGAGNPVSLCYGNATPAGYSTNNTDCNDIDNMVWRSAPIYIDADGDGYDAGQTTLCYGATAPTGYSLTTNGTDCNDADASVHSAPNVASISSYVGSSVNNSICIGGVFDLLPNTWTPGDVASYSCTSSNSATSGISGLTTNASGQLIGIVSSASGVYTYQLIVTRGTGSSCSTTVTATVTVNDLPIVSAGSYGPVCLNNGLVTLAGTPAGGTWSGTGVSGSTGNYKFDPTSGTQTLTYAYSNGTCSNSSQTTVTVKAAPNAVATPTSQTTCSGSDITTIVLTGSLSGTTFTWTRDNTLTCRDMASSGSGNIRGELTNTTTEPVTVTFTITPSANGCTGTPITATILVNPKTKISGNPANQNILALGMASFNVTATGVSVTYQWQVSANGGTSYINALNSGVYSGANDATLNLTAVPLSMNGYKYRCVVIGTCTKATSSAALLTVGNPCQNATGLTTTSITTSGAKLNWNAVSDPDQWQVQYKTTSNGSVWKDVILAGNQRSVTISSLLANQNYNWHIRAKCGTNWLDYTGTVSFKTLAVMKSLSISKVDSTITKKLQAKEAIKVFPNPSIGDFTLILQLGGTVDAKANIQLVNILGQTILTDDAKMTKGVLQKTISTPSSFANGLYVVKVIVDKKQYETQLILNR